MQRTQRAWLHGFIGMLMFSGTLPATRLAVATLDPVFLTVARATIAGLIGLAILTVRPAALPDARELARLAILSAGCVIRAAVASAYRRWGKGFHHAGLNFGDCFAYEVAMANDCPLLFVGDDFSKSDVRRAI